MKIETVLFDFDGTLADTNELIRRSHLEVLEEYYPGEYDAEKVRAFNGPPLDLIYSNINFAEKETMIAKYRAFNELYHDELVTLFDGVQNSLRLLKQNGIQLGVVSTKRNDTLLKGIKLLGLDGLFDTVVGGMDYTHPKPDPEPILVAMSRLNCRKETTIMVGDNFHDILSAKNAGIPGVFVGWSEKTLEEIAPYAPSFIVHTMEELTELVLTHQLVGNEKS
ncbi:MAG: pyrophosphatase PpaX [Carnobacterium sp.]|uniref:pyrophosphatase PpaX n=1 Tax=Carnobacterium sp. TaxID=48221 RepID=UPI002FCC109A